MDFTRSSQSTQKGKIHFASRRESSAVGFNGARRSTARSRESYLPSFYRQPGRTKAVGLGTKSSHGHGMDAAWARGSDVQRRGTHYDGAAIGGAAERSVCPSRGCGMRGDGGLGVGIGAEALGSTVTARYRRACPVGRRRGLA
jgi:hypothetical protein